MLIMRETPINSLLTKTYPMVTVAQWLELITVLYLSFYSVGKIELFNQLSSVRNITDLYKPCCDIKTMIITSNRNCMRSIFTKLITLSIHEVIHNV